MSRFQSFEDRSDRDAVAGRVARLRSVLAEFGLDGFVVPRSDEHQSEYVPACAERLAWLTGFTGSAGSAVILSGKAALVVDGRYTIQAAEQTDIAVIAPVQLASQSVEDWIAAELAGGTIGYDPWLLTPDQARRIADAARRAGGSAVAVASNPIDAIWNDRPPAPCAPVRLHPEALAGESAADKLGRVREALVKAQVAGLLVSDPHNLAWTFNIRGGDVDHTPLALGYAYVPATGRPTVYLDGRKLDGPVRAAFAGLADLAEPDELPARLAKLGSSGARIRFDKTSVAAALVSGFQDSGGEADLGLDPVSAMKAVKNEAERAGARAAHRRDAAALVRFLAWFDGQAPSGRLTEISAAEALERFRSETGALRDLSFPSISAAGPNAALPHYRVTEASDRPVGPGIYLIDSGAQYEDGTTDVTRTIAVGPPDALMQDRYTRVLKGHIAIARAVFPKGTSGAQIDALARLPLWEAGLDFDHGTGHGVGSYLSVHEGPQRISRLGTVALEPGMILSNEPGYYLEGRFGIRIENLVLVREAEIEGAERPMLDFETLTLAPIDTRLIAVPLLSPAEIAWLDAYHARVRREIGPLVEGEVRAWLEQATAPLQP